MKKTLLSTAEVARLLQVTETTVKRWTEDGSLTCRKTPGGHRKFEIQQLLEFSRRNNLELAGTLEFSEKNDETQKVEMAVLSKDYRALMKFYIEKALSPSQSDLHRFFSYLYQHHFSLPEIFDHVIKQGMDEIGNEWEKGTLAVHDEHHASYETLDAISKLQLEIAPKTKKDALAICACLDDELHDLGLRCVANLLESEGWNVHYLGARTPHTQLPDTIKRLKPTLVCISSTTSENRIVLHSRIDSVIRAAHREKAKVIIGGRTFSQKEKYPVRCDAVCASSQEVLDYLKAVAASSV